MRLVRASLLLLLSSRAFAGSAIEPLAPEFPSQAVWLNARDLSMERLRGRRVVLVAFLSTMNINSRRAVSALKALDERYALDGLMVVGVHTPEFAFQKDPAALKDALRAMGVGFPVIIDNERLVWKAFANDGWPAFYIVDRKGHIVYDRLGEGGYEELESNLRLELDKLAGTSGDGGPVLRDIPPLGGECGEMTPEVSLGSRRSMRAVDLDQGDLPESLVLVRSRDGELSTRGNWRQEPDDLLLGQQNADLSAFVRVIYRGAQGFGVLASGERGPSKFWLRQDDLWLDSTSAGADVRFDAEKRNYVMVGAPRLYDLVRNPNDNIHELAVIPLLIGSRIFGFSFSNKCLAGP